MQLAPGPDYSPPAASAPPPTGLGASFSVHPSAFAVHVPHGKSTNNRASFRSGQGGKVRLVPPERLHCLSGAALRCA